MLCSRGSLGTPSAVNRGDARLSGRRRRAVRCARRDEGRMFRSDGLKVGGRVFGMEVNGRLVVKLSSERAASL